MSHLKTVPMVSLETKNLSSDPFLDKLTNNVPNPLVFGAEKRLVGEGLNSIKLNE